MRQGCKRLLSLLGQSTERVSLLISEQRPGNVQRVESSSKDWKCSQVWLKMSNEAFAQWWVCLQKVV